jgi:hypothetical protein
MRKANNSTDDQENITHHAKRQRRDDATHHYQQLYRGRFGFLRKENKPALKKRYNRTDQSQRVVEQTGMACRIARWKAPAAHFRRFRN